MPRSTWSRWLLCAALAAPGVARAQGNPPEKLVVDLRFRVASSLPGNHRAVPAVAWLTPLAGTSVPPFTPQGHYTLLQKNRMFIPHLQVIPVGAVVQFPNADPFYHNVFSLFEGKRFDLGLYEAGSSKSVTFQREGVSYIFCNIHPEMSAVIVTLVITALRHCRLCRCICAARNSPGRLQAAYLDRRCSAILSRRPVENPARLRPRPGSRDRECADCTAA